VPATVRDAVTLVSGHPGSGAAQCAPPGRGFFHEPEGVFDVAAVCDVCGKGPGFGKSVSHSHRKTNRRWNPNIQTVHAKIGLSQRKRMNVCTSCLRAGKVVRG
jgi:large subunit ribosomal protein L28